MEQLLERFVAPLPCVLAATIQQGDEGVFRNREVAKGIGKGDGDGMRWVSCIAGVELALPGIQSRDHVVSRCLVGNVVRPPAPGVGRVDGATLHPRQKTESDGKV